MSLVDPRRRRRAERLRSTLALALRRIPRAASGFALGVALLFGAWPAWAFAPPPQKGHVTDLAGALGEGEKATLEAEMTAIEQASRLRIAVLVLATLGGQPIEDVATATARGWGLGEGAKEGVVLVIATGERRARIEVARGLQDRLTDPETRAILAARIAPELDQGRLYQGIYEGVAGIDRAAAGDLVATPRVDLSDHQKGPSLLVFLLIPAALVALAFTLPWLLLRLGVRDRVRAVRDDDGLDWSGGSGDVGGGGADGGASDLGGGDAGGQGSSDS